MFDYTVIGYTYEGECYHSDCLDGDLSHDGTIYAGEEGVGNLPCAGCGEYLAEEFDY